MASAGDGAGAPHPEIDWKAAEESSEFKELVARKRRFVLPATIFYLAWFFGFVLLCGYAPDFMGSEFLADGLTVGYVLAFSQFVMVWVLCWAYVRIADREFDPLAEKAANTAIQAGRGGGAPQAAATGERPATAGVSGEGTPR